MTTGLLSQDCKPQVTIAIPIYNAEAYLAFAIQSVINQTYKDWVLLLLCDGSTDKSNDIANAFAKADKRIKCIDDGKNRGLVYRLNQSIQITTTKYYARMDADDIMYITRIEEQIRYLEENSEVDVVGSSMMIIDNKNNVLDSEYKNGDFVRFIHPSVMGRTNWFKCNPYAEWALRAEDVELWTRTVLNSNFYEIEKPLLFYREFGVPTFRKYYLSQITLLKIFSRYRNYKKTFIWFLSNTIMTCIKMIVYFIFYKIGNIDYLVRKRRRTPVPENLQLSQRDLEISINKLLKFPTPSEAAETGI